MTDRDAPGEESTASGPATSPPPLERLDARDWRFLAICLLVIAAGAAVTSALFRKAFPEASIEFRVNRAQARAVGEKFLVSRGRHPEAERFAGRFAVDEEPKVYLERELGLEKAGRLYGTTAKVWRWDMRWFRSGVKEEEGVSITPLGDLVAFEFQRREDAPGPRPSEAAAREIAERFLASRSLPAASLTRIESTPTSRPNRTDWTFVDERAGAKLGEATVRYQTTVSVGEVSAFREFVHVPEAWQRDYARLRSKNEAAGAVATAGLVVTAVAMLVSLLGRIVRRDVRWKLVAAFGSIGFLLSLLSTLNSIPLTLYDKYDTASPLSSFLTERVVLGVLGAIAVGALIAFIVAAAEPEYRDGFRARLSLPGIFSARGLRTKGFFKGVVLGYALVAFFFAYQAIFYVVAAKFGAWSPADIPYDDMLNTAAPWATVLLIGFLPAVSEEGISRLYSISLLRRLGAGRFLALVVPAAIWGFGHSAYPNQPFFIRGLEVGLAGVVIGAVMLRFGAWPLLVWHFTVDAIYTALLMLRSKNAYYVGSGAVAAGILLVPLAVSAALAWRRGGFLPETGLANGDLGTAPPRPRRVSAAAGAGASVRPLSRAVRWGALAVAIALAATFARSASSASDVARDETGRRNAADLARAFLRANGVAAEGFRAVTYAGTGFADAEEMRDRRPEEDGRIPAFSSAAARYVLLQGGLSAYERLAGKHLPVALWVTRFFRPEKKEEWKVLVDARRSRVVAFVHPLEEAAPAGPPVDPERAKARALAAAGALGYPAAAYAVADLGTRDRPKRRDTTVVLESRPAGVGAARPRLTAVFHGDSLAAFLPSVQIPEEFLREYRKKSPLDWGLLAVKVVAIGGLAGIGLVLFLRVVRAPDFHWRAVLAPTLVVGACAAASAANGVATVLRAYPTETPLRLFLVLVAVSLFLVWLIGLLAAYIGFVLFEGARPGWRAALRRGGSLADGFFRAAVAAAGLAGISHVAALAAARFPSLFEPDPSLPASLSTALPSYGAFWGAARGTFGLAAAAAVAALALRQDLGKASGRIVAVAALLLAALPGRISGAGEFLAEYLPAVAVLAWLAFAALRLLADHAAAWILFGAFAFGGPAVAELLAQGAAADRHAGWGAALFLAVAVAALIAGRRAPAGRPSASGVPPPPLSA